MDIITNEQSRELFSTLYPGEAQFLVQFLLQNVNQYKASGIQVDFPYYFYSIHKDSILRGEEFPAQYIDTQLTPDECSFLTIYYITKALIRDRGKRR